MMALNMMMFSHFLHLLDFQLKISSKVLILAFLTILGPVLLFLAVIGEYLKFSEEHFAAVEYFIGRTRRSLHNRQILHFGSKLFHAQRAIHDMLIFNHGDLVEIFTTRGTGKDRKVLRSCQNEILQSEIPRVNPPNDFDLEILSPSEL